MDNNGTNRLRIVVVGGGIAGLAAAAVLRQRHDVTIYERDSASAPERGAGIGLGPNGSKMLKKAFQFCPEDVKATVCPGSRTYDKEGNLLREITGVTEPFGSEWLLMHRADLRDVLLRLATGDAAKLGISGPPATIVEGVEVTGVDVEAGKVMLKDGKEIDADVIVGADGIHSSVRQAIMGEPAHFLSTGVSLYRFTFPLEKAHEILKEYPPAIDPSNGGFFNMMTVNDETNRNVIFYPCRNLTTLNVIARIPDSMLAVESVTSWNAEGSSEEMLDHFFDFAPWMLEIMKHAEDVHLYKVKDTAPLPTYTRGRAVVVGDAAHPMTPFQGQGATQAVEDAEGLRLLLHENVNADNISHTLRTWDSVRRPRASQVQLNSRHVIDMSAQAQLDRMRLNWTYSGIHAALRNR
ncbi:SAM50-like protein SPAC17C9.06 [Colletotrichum spaethianum]|uniref:SAM50-like protein SPAC17C9.06 n=1 Tax=Colletotrichum spaethianum TaxID=700344 RepID=A0AA37LDX9_9PEZI|nr:SAM50-like protein SPAC17C9.06 [Colletotrichum spaethianum]GKT46871.1 SAM50-like protein SPAC17C9.06 [Colletotrichum spaethianum]